MKRISQGEINLAALSVVISRAQGLPERGVLYPVEVKAGQHYGVVARCSLSSSGLVHWGFSVLYTKPSPINFVGISGIEGFLSGASAALGLDVSCDRDGFVEIKNLRLSGKRRDILAGYLASLVIRDTVASRLHAMILPGRVFAKDIKRYFSLLLANREKSFFLLRCTNHVSYQGDISMSTPSEPACKFNMAGDWTLPMDYILAQHPASLGDKVTRINWPYSVLDLFSGRRGFGFELDQGESNEDYFEILEFCLRVAERRWVK